MRFTVKNKMVLVGALSVVALAVATVLAYRTNGSVKRATNQNSENNAKIKRANNMRLHVARLGLAVMECIEEAGEKKVNEEQLKVIEEVEAEFRRDLAAINKLTDADEREPIREVADEFHKALRLTKNDLRQAIVRGADAKRLTVLDEAIDGHGQKADRKLVYIMKHIQKEVDESTAELSDRLAAASVTTVLTSVVAGFVIVALLFFLGRGIVRSLAQMVEAAGAMREGDVDVEVDVRTQDEVGQLADAFRDMARTQRDMANSAKALGRGDLSVQVAPRSGRDVLGHSLKEMVESIRGLNDNIQDTIREQTAGDIEARCNPERFEGGFADLARGVNETLDAVIKPVLEGIQIMGKYAHGDLSEKMRDLPGKQIVLTQGLNGIRDNLLRLVEETKAVISGAVQGKLNVRADATRFQGAYAEITRGLNEILEAVVTPINEAADVLERLAGRDLTARVQGDYRGDHAKIKRSLNATGDALHDAMVQVAGAVDQLSTASEQIASGSQAVAQGASEQASSLEETSSSLEEMASMTRQNADNTQEARTLAQTTNGAATNGREAMEQMVRAMGKIRAASEGTAQIIKDINEIAFQTNLLALNAAVEAARAGDAGRGFAVVSEEVRALAQRSKEAAKKTEELIKESVSLAEQGEEITKHASDNLLAINDSVGKVTSIIEEIAVASQEQARGIEQVNAGVTQMDSVAQQSAANAEESASAAEELSSQSQELASLVARFTLDGSSGSRRAVRAKETTKTVPPAFVLPKGKGNGKSKQPAAPAPMALADMFGDDDADFRDF
jgi:methyl-accepting chemotaxis protein